MRPVVPLVLALSLFLTACSGGRGDDPVRARERRLAAHQVSFDVRGAPLEEVLAQLSTRTGVAVRVDPALLRRRSPRVDLHLTQVPALVALDAIAAQTGLERRVEAGTVELFDPRTIFLEFYDVADLTQGPHPRWDTETLGDLIQQATSPRGWAPPASLCSSHGVLIVRQQTGVHQRIRALLAHLRRCQGQS